MENKGNLFQVRVARVQLIKNYNLDVDEDTDLKKLTENLTL